MKPYIAIMIDSFWEAVTNKILWGLLICWTLLLGGLAPFGYVTEVGYRFHRGDLRTSQGLAQKLAKGLTVDATAKQKAVSNHLSEALKKQLREANAAPDVKQRNDLLQKIRSRDLITELNKLLENRELFQADTFDTVAQIDALKPIIEKAPDKRSKLEVQQLNRNLLSLTYSAELKNARSEEIWIGYAGIKIGSQLQFDRAEINVFIEGIALQIIIRLGLSFVVVFVGLIITSPMIPETFRSGSLHLLLSKPVSRSLIYLTKFFGGTVFVLINIAYLLTGLYLLIGWRLGIWNVGLIWCIPLLLFVFVIFYSVSALIGLIWNNPILCVVVCIVFWIFCLTIGAIEGGMRVAAVWLPQILRFEQVGDHLLAITQSSEVKIWNEKYKVWQPAADVLAEGPGRVLGPIYDAERQRLIMRSDFSNGMGGLETRSRNLILVDLKDQAEASSGPDDDSVAQNVEEARKKMRWDGESGPEPPMLVIDLLRFGEKTLAVTRNGFFEINWKAEEMSEVSKGTPSIFGDLSSWLNRIGPQTFRDLSPDAYVFGESVRVTATPDAQSLILYNSNRVDSLTLQPNGKFIVEHKRQIGKDVKVSALIAASNNFVLVGREKQPLLVLDRKLGQVVTELSLSGNVDPRQLHVVGDSDLFSIVDHNNRFWLLDPATKSVKLANCPHQGSITGLTWISNEQAWLGVRPNRALLWNRTNASVVKTLAPTPSKLDLFYNYVARPLYVVSPKPSSLNGVLQKLLQRERAGQTQLLNNDLSAFRLEIEVWQPIVSNLIFVAVLLGIGCIYVWRREF